MAAGSILSELRLTLSSHPEEINRVVVALETFAKSSHLKAATVRVLGLMLEEFVTNSVTHGGGGRDVKITLSLKYETDHLRLSYVDNGVAFNPITDLPPDTRDKVLDERSVGGLGWPLVFHYAASVEYRREGGQNIYELSVSADQPGEW